MTQSMRMMMMCRELRRGGGGEKAFVTIILSVVFCLTTMYLFVSN